MASPKIVSKVRDRKISSIFLLRIFLVRIYYKLGKLAELSQLRYSQSYISFMLDDGMKVYMDKLTTIVVSRTYPYTGRIRTYVHHGTRSNSFVKSSLSERFAALSLWLQNRTFSCLSELGWILHVHIYFPLIITKLSSVTLDFYLLTDQKEMGSPFFIILSIIANQNLALRLIRKIKQDRRFFDTKYFYHILLGGIQHS